MTRILHFRRHLSVPPDALEGAGICVRNFGEAGDEAAWISLRDRAMAAESPHVRTWSEDEFFSEMQSKPWWRDDRTWMAKAGDLRSPDPKQLVGAVTLALRQGARATVPVVHWLLVDPAWRRRGVARLLMSRLESAAWDDGWREIELETHSNWQAAVAFYQSIGYAPVRDRSPR
jgi:GNAT superfamily N-acetyltransferase